MIVGFQNLVEASRGLDGGLVVEPHHRLGVVVGELMLQAAELGADLPPGAAEYPVAEHVLMDMYQHIVMVGFPADDHDGSGVGGVAAALAAPLM